MQELTFGAVGIGQAGINIASHFAQKFPTIIIDTAAQNLNNCQQVSKDLKYHAKINSWGGAGKQAALGEKAIEQHSDAITDLLDNNLRECQFVWVIAGLGGGTGSAGHLIVSNLLDYLNIPHGLFITLPDETQEGIDEITNAYIALGKVEEARTKFDSLSSVIIIENKKLRQKVLNQEQVSFENSWNEANKYIFNKFYQLYEYSQKESSYSFDGQDYLRILSKSGYMIFGDQLVENIEEGSKNILINEFEATWENSIFTDTLAFTEAKGIGIVIDRPESYSDGAAIDRLLNKMNDFVGVGTICSGIYKTKTGLKDKVLNADKPLKMIALISGMPFPQQRFKELEDLALKGAEEYENKGGESDLQVKMDKLKSIIGSGKPTKKPDNRKEFSVFGKTENEKNIRANLTKSNK
jgi:cell division GTPase FtsZ